MRYSFRLRTSFMMTRSWRLLTLIKEKNNSQLKSSKIEDGFIKFMEMCYESGQDDALFDVLNLKLQPKSQSQSCTKNYS